MRNALCFLLYLAMLSPGFTHMAQAADPAYVVSYLEAMPGARDRTADLIRQFARTSRKDAGNVRFEILSQIGRPGLFAILETWEDSQAQTAHAEAPHTKLFREKLHPMSGSLYDERLYRAMK
jgi:quinol monooxygenase YgiN